MLKLLYGQDTYQSKEELRKIIEQNKIANRDWLDFIRIDGSSKNAETFKQMRETLDTISMFGTNKLAIIENVFLLDGDEQEEILKFLQKRTFEKNNDVVIVFWTDEAENKSDLFKYLKNKAEITEFKPLDASQLKKWVKNYAEIQGGSINILATDRLIGIVGNDLWRMGNELNKLLSYDKTIKLENIELLIKPEIDLNVFELVDAIGSKNRANALSLLEEHFNQGEDELRLLGMIIYQIRNLILVISSSPGELNLHPYVIKKTTQQARNFSIEELKKIYHQLMTIDLEFKIGKTDIQSAMELFLTNFC